MSPNITTVSSTADAPRPTAGATARPSSPASAAVKFEQSVVRAIDTLDASHTLSVPLQFWVQQPHNNNNNTTTTTSNKQSKPANQLSSNEYLASFTACPDSMRFETLKAALSYADELLATHQGRVLLFKDGIEPTWEDKANANGGRFHLSCFSPEQTRLGFLALVALVCAPRSALAGLPSGSELMPFNAFSGFQVCMKPGQLSVELWNKNARNADTIKHVRKTLKGLFRRNILYYVHKTSVSIKEKGIEAVAPMRKNNKMRRDDASAAPAAARRNRRNDSSPSDAASWRTGAKHSKSVIVAEESARSRVAAEAARPKTSTVSALETALVSTMLQNAWTRNASSNQAAPVCE